jgi:hypothetical protein
VASNNMKLGLLHDEGNGTHSYSDQFFVGGIFNGIGFMG